MVKKKKKKKKKNTDTLPENYTEDYLKCFEGLHNFIDYFALKVCPNVSSHGQIRRCRLPERTNYRGSKN